MNRGCWSIVIAKHFGKWYPSSPLRITALDRQYLIRWIVQYLSNHDHDVNSEVHNLNVTVTSCEMENFVPIVFSIACIYKSNRKYFCVVYFYNVHTVVTNCLCAFFINILVFISRIAMIYIAMIFFSFVLEKDIVCDVCGLRSPSFESSSVLYISPTDTSSMQNLILEGLQQKLQKSCSRCNKNTWHVEISYILQLQNICFSLLIDLDTLIIMPPTIDAPHLWIRRLGLVPLNLAYGLL